MHFRDTKEELEVQEAAIQNKNIFAELMEATKVCSLGQITKAFLKSVGNTGEICESVVR